MREPGAIPDSSYNRVLFKPIQLLGRFTFGDVGDFVERGVLIHPLFVFRKLFRPLKGEF